MISQFYFILRYETNFVLVHNRGGKFNPKQPYSAHIHSFPKKNRKQEDLRFFDLRI